VTKYGGADDRGRGARSVRCEWCQRLLDARTGPGRPRRFCRQGCRQQAYLARKLAAAHGLGDDQLIVDRATFEAAQDRIALLRQALADVDREAGGDLPLDLEQAYLWVRRHAVEVAELQLLPAWQAGLNAR
jgi:hypothetical protein